VLGDARGDLPAARAEAIEVAQRLGMDPFLGSTATIASFRAAGSGRVLHVASHVEMSAAGPRLVLADGTVGAREVMEWRVKPQVVVLASCLGAVRRSRGVWGSLSAAFLASGSRSVVAALSSVEDRSARELLSEFYRQGGAVEPSRSLASAQRTFIAAGRPPSFWSPFVVLGSGRPVRARK
jgi:CHAT domain-containing protein